MEIENKEADYVNNLINHLHNIREQIRQLEEQEKSIKNYIHYYMTNNNTNAFITDKWICQRKLRERDYISKKNVPEEIWDEYYTTSIYPVLLFKCKN